MKIIILGAGHVGNALAQTLVNENHDITVVDDNADQLEQISSNLDVRTVLGHSSYPKTLAAAGADECDMLIAVTSSDEVNMVACQVAYSLFHVPKKIARIKADEYMLYNDLFDPNHMPIDVFISPEELMAARISKLIEYPGTLQVLNFCSEKITMLAIKCLYNSQIISKKISELNPDITKVSNRVVAIFRSNRAIQLDSDTSIEIGDEIFLIAAHKDIKKLLKDINPDTEKYNNIIINGGNRTGYLLSKLLENNYQVKLIEKDLERCKHLAEILKKTTILHGEGSDTNLLNNESISDTDVFCAVTSDDESNIMACLQAKRLGVNPVIATISRRAYVDLIQDGPINIAISPQQVTVGSILAQVRRGDILTVHSLRRGIAEAIEVVAHGDEKTSKVVGKKLREIKLPAASNIAAIMRAGKVILPNSDTEIQSEDRIVIFVSQKQHISQIEKLVKVKATFF